MLEKCLLSHDIWLTPTPLVDFLKETRGGKENVSEY